MADQYQQPQSSKMYGNQLQNFLGVLSGGTGLMKQLKDNVLEKLYYRQMQLATEGDEEAKQKDLEFRKASLDAMDKLERDKLKGWQTAQDRLANQNAAGWGAFMDYLKGLKDQPVTETIKAPNMFLLMPTRDPSHRGMIEDLKRRNVPFNPASRSYFDKLTNQTYYVIPEQIGINTNYEPLVDEEYQGHGSGFSQYNPSKYKK